MATRLPNYQMRDGRTRLGQDYFNPIWADLDSRLDTLERIKLDWNAQVAQLRDLGLQRIDEYIRPVVDEVDALLAQATEETNGLAQELVNEHLQPLVDSANALLAQVQSDTDTLAQDLVDQHLQPKLDEANTLLAQAQQSADDLAAALDAFSTTASRTDPSTDTLLQAKAMNDHRQSGDHDARYYTKQEVGDLIEENAVDSIYPTDPVSPAGGQVPDSVRPNLVGGDYLPLHGVPQGQREFHIIETGGSWSSPLYSGVEMPTATRAVATSHVPDISLTPHASYQWRYRDTTSQGDTGPWSSVADFVAPEGPSSLQIGDPYAGGYFGGIVTSDHDATDYAIIISDGSGDSVQMGAGTMAWRTSRTSVSTTHGVPPMTLADGRANHDAVLAVGNLNSFPAFEWIENTCNAGVGLNGYNDWYLPARDELELLYRHFKPTTQDNNTGARTASGFGGDGAVYGTNASSVPAGAGYTASDPAQTTEASFQGGPDAFEASPYWSSTELSDTNAWLQYFNNGIQYANVKDFSFRVRAVRRVAL